MRRERVRKRDNDIMKRERGIKIDRERKRE